jgi:hypothetical protein
VEIERPNTLPHFLVWDRFVIGQDEKTAQKRTQFFRLLSEQLRFSNEVSLALNELATNGTERQKREKEIELEKLKLDIESQRLIGVRDLERTREEMKLQVEIARLEKEMADIR